MPLSLRMLLVCWRLFCSLIKASPGITTSNGEGAWLFPKRCLLLLFGSSVFLPLFKFDDDLSDSGNRCCLSSLLFEIFAVCVCLVYDDDKDCWYYYVLERMNSIQTTERCNVIIYSCSCCFFLFQSFFFCCGIFGAFFILFPSWEIGTRIDWFPWKTSYCANNSNQIG